LDSLMNSVMLLVICFAVLHLSFAPFICDDSGKPPKDTPQPAYDNKMRAQPQRYYGGITQYVSTANPSQPCPVTCSRTPPPGCQANCSSGYEWSSYSLSCIDINECTNGPYPCQNGGICINGPGNYSCNCIGLYAGANCERLGVDCEDYNPCTEVDSWYPSKYPTDPEAFIACYQSNCIALSCTDFAPAGLVFEPNSPFIPEIFYPCFPPEIAGEINCGSHNHCPSIQEIWASEGEIYFPVVSSSLVPSTTDYIKCTISDTEDTCTDLTCASGTTYQKDWVLTYTTETPFYQVCA